MRLIALLLLAPLLAFPEARPCAAQSAGPEPADVALVLVSDVSRSIDDSEFELEKRGYAAAFADPQVLTAITSGPRGGILAAYVEFSGEEAVNTVVGWTFLHDAASVQSFAQTVRAAPRSSAGHTAIGAGITHAMHLITSSHLDVRRQVIDVAGDGTNNSGGDVNSARDAAVAAGMTVNGLAIINEHPAAWLNAHVQPPGGLDNYYRQNVTGGPGSFVIDVHDFRDFQTGLIRKLVEEIAARPRHLG
jgi:hypothetical protein